MTQNFVYECVWSLWILRYVAFLHFNSNFCHFQRLDLSKLLRESKAWTHMRNFYVLFFFSHDVKRGWKIANGTHILAEAFRDVVRLQWNVLFIHACDTKFQGLTDQKKNAPLIWLQLFATICKRTKSVHTNGDCRKIIIVISFWLAQSSILVVASAVFN